MEPINDLQERITDTASTMRDDATQIAEEMQSRAQDAWQAAQDQAQNALQQGSATMREYPLSTAMIAFVLGFVIGRAITHHHEESFGERYVTEPLHRTRGMLLGLPLAFMALLPRFNRSTIRPLKKAVGV
jgi:ElaB/YqjD/DUF883 family membrane-anchored ribosome-binding protein